MGVLPFQDFKPDQVLRASLDGPNDQKQHDFSIPTRSPLVKDPPAKADMAFAECLDSYLQGLDSLGDACERSNQNLALVRIFAYPPAPVLPAIFLCHHIVELSLKQILFTEHEDFKRTHKLSNIWQSCSHIVEKKAGIHQRKALWKFVSFIDNLDPNSTDSRYPIQIERDGQYHTTEGKISWINVKKLSEYTGLFVKTLRENKLIPKDAFSQIKTQQLPYGIAFVEGK